jgi:hypothetical protein
MKENKNEIKEDFNLSEVKELMNEKKILLKEEEIEEKLIYYLDENNDKEMDFKLIEKIKELLKENPILIKEEEERNELKNSEEIKNPFTNNYNNNNHENEFLDEISFVQYLNLIKSRDLRRKPRAYLNAKYPLNEISRAIYAGIATKKGISFHFLN